MLQLIEMVLASCLTCRVIAWAFPAESDDDYFRRFKESFEHRKSN